MAEMKRVVSLVFLLVPILAFNASSFGASEQFKGSTYRMDDLKATDSQPRLKVGDRAPDFALPSIKGEKVSLGGYLGSKNVVLSFVPAAWTPVCSEQWPGYNILKDEFDRQNTVLVGITTDNLPTLYAWTEQMGGVWFPVLSDFWPHGEVSRKYGVLRSSGVSERALFLIDKKGIIRYIDVHDIKERPNTELLLDQVKKLKK